MEKHIEYTSIRDGSLDSEHTSDIADDHNLLGIEHPQRYRHTLSLRSAFIKGLATTLGIATYTLIVILAAWHVYGLKSKEHRYHGTRFLPSPANDHIVYESRVMEQWEDEFAPKYFGEPNEQLDRNWHELFQYQNLALPAELMHNLGRQDEGIMLPDGTYFGSMMVFHHLHCLKNIQRSLHPSYYGMDNLKGKALAKHWDHTDHCLHMLMDAVMCQGDTTLITMLWQDSMFRPAGNFTSPHECINWNMLMEWVKPNSRDLTKDGILVHPKHGPLFKHGEPTETFFRSISEGGFGMAPANIAE